MDMFSPPSILTTHFLVRMQIITNAILIGGVGATGCREAREGAPKVVGGDACQEEGVGGQD